MKNTEMEPFIIEPTTETPQIILDPDHNIFTINRRSLPENPLKFYTPVIEWIKEYTQHPNAESNFVFKLEYFNTASSKQLMKILVNLKKITNKGKLTITWYHKTIDEDMKNIGLRYSKLLEYDFEMIAY